MTDTDKSTDFFRCSIKLWGLLTAAGAVVSAATLFGFLGRLSYFLDLFSHFRVQYVLVLFVLGIVFVIGRRRIRAALFLALACVNLVPVLPLYFGASNNPEETRPEMRAMLLNVNTHFGNPDRVKTVVSAADPDILVLEEVSSRWMTKLAWLSDTDRPLSALRRYRHC